MNFETNDTRERLGRKRTMILGDGEVAGNLCSRLMVNRDPRLARRSEINATEAAAT